MNDFSNVVITTDAGSMCAHADVGDDVEQSLRRLLVTVWCFLEQYRHECGNVDMPLCRIAEDIESQAAGFLYDVRSYYIEDMKGSER